MTLTIGSEAPDFRATDGGADFTLSSMRGKWVVLYFYPKDNTSGCTKEACDFRDNMERISSMGVEVLGVSPDSASSHDKFKESFSLNFKLIADPEKEICNLYGVIGEKSMYGKKYMGVVRSTFILDENGIIMDTFSNVKVPGHVDAVIKRLNELKTN